MTRRSCRSWCSCCAASTKQPPSRWRSSGEAQPVIDLQPGRWVELAGIEPRPRWTRRLAAFSALAVILSSVLVWRLDDLQLVPGPSFASLALVNRVHRLPVMAERGVIYDRHGIQLVINQPAWSLAVTEVA